jgi:hypothetical protein
MRQGTTPTLTFTLPFEVADLVKCDVDFAQNNKVVLSKKIEDCTLSENTVAVTLTEDETLNLSTKQLLEMQISVQKSDNTIARSKPIVAKVGKALSGEAL